MNHHINTNHIVTTALEDVLQSVYMEEGSIAKFFSTCREEKFGEKILARRF
jgi:hypothetical protein